MNRRRIIGIVVTRRACHRPHRHSGFGLFGDERDAALALYGNVDIREVDMAFRVGGRIDDHRGR